MSRNAEKQQLEERQRLQQALRPRFQKLWRQSSIATALTTFAMLAAMGTLAIAGNYVPDTAHYGWGIAIVGAHVTILLSGLWVLSIIPRWFATRFRLACATCHRELVVSGRNQAKKAENMYPGWLDDIVPLRCPHCGVFVEEYVQPTLRPGAK